MREPENQRKRSGERERERELFQWCQEKKENTNFHAISSHRMQDSRDATNASLATKLSAQQTCCRERSDVCVRLIFSAKLINSK
jgi:hypothetical protein